MRKETSIVSNCEHASTAKLFGPTNWICIRYARSDKFKGESTRKQAVFAKIELLLG